MNIILLSNFCKKKGSIDICVPRAAAWLIPGLLAVSALLVWAGFEFGSRHAEVAQTERLTEELQAMLDQERRVIETARAGQQAHLDALALRVANIQAHLMRVDALGDRLVSIGKLDAGEFDFTTEPPVGGTSTDEPGEAQTVLDLHTDMQRLGQILADREEKLSRLEEQLLSRELIERVLPSGKPVKKGWMSSSYGKRTDPFTGKKTLHRGLDFAGKPGTEVHAVATGIVTRSKKVAGYGNVIEISHSDGYSTLYGHNKENLVKDGDMVTKGQTIALLGSTGRSSGPHVHFEVHKDGKHVNPRRFVN